jgi:hypothetical protein
MKGANYCSSKGWVNKVDFVNEKKCPFVPNWVFSFKLDGKRGFLKHLCLLWTYICIFFVLAQQFDSACNCNNLYGQY